MLDIQPYRKPLKFSFISDGELKLISKIKSKSKNITFFSCNESFINHSSKVYYYFCYFTRHSLFKTMMVVCYCFKSSDSSYRYVVDFNILRTSSFFLLFWSRLKCGIFRIWNFHIMNKLRSLSSLSSSGCAPCRTIAVQAKKLTRRYEKPCSINGSC